MMKGYTKKSIVFLIILAVFLLVRFSGLERNLTLENIQLHKTQLETFVKNHYVKSVIVYIVIYLIITGCSIPSAAVLILSGGFLFGVIAGTLYVNVGATIGATFAFLSARYLIGDWVQKKYVDKLKKFNREIKENGYSYLLMMRFTPLLPFVLVNFFAGMTKIPLWTFIWTTSVGILPASLLYTFAGKQISSIHSTKDILSLKIIIALLLLTLFSFVPVIVKKKYNNKNSS